MYNINNYHKFFFEKVLPPLIFFIFPILVINNLWDGVIYDHLLEERDFQSLKRNFHELRYEIFYYIHIFIFQLHNKLNISLSVIQDSLVFIIIFFLFYELNRILRLFNLNPTKYFYIIYFSLPFWHNLTSFPNFYNLCLVSISVFSFRLYLKKSFFKNLIAIFFLIISFNLKSNLTLIFGLTIFSFFYQFKNRTNYELKLSKFIFLVIFVLFSILISFYYFSPHGEYSNHNHIDFYNLNFLKILNSFFDFVYIYLFIVIIFLIYLIKSEKLIYKHNFNLILFFIFIFITIMPYVLVYKSPNLLSFGSFDGRHGLTYIIPIIILISFIFNFFSNSKYLIQIFMCLFFFNFSLSTLGFIAKFEHSKIMDKYINNLKNVSDEFDFKPGKVIIKIEGQNPNLLAFYELNYIFKKAFKKTNWIVQYDQIEHSLIKNTKSDYFKKKYVLNDYSDKCTTRLTIEGYENIFDRIKFLINSKNYYNFKLIEEDCN